VYAVDLDEHYEAFIAGRTEDPTADPAFVDWLEYVSTLTAAGRRMERVRIQQDPPSDYHRYARWVGGWNVRAGEVIHYTTHERAADVGLLPAAGDDDWWLLDDANLVIMEFDAVGTLTGLRLETDDAPLMRARAFKELAMRAVRS
jgi:hypothetical protein